jgi:L-aspartate oxidase
VQEYYANFRVSNNLLELRNLLQVAELIVNCALERKESRGLHYNLDYPDMQPDSKPTVLTPDPGNDAGSGIRPLRSIRAYALPR